MRQQVVLQEKTPLSKSLLWTYQQDYFEREGVDAWENDVPFYVTSNPYIANSYANIVIRFMQDYAKKASYKKDEPFYIIELGVGSGRFSFYMVKRLLELQSALELQSIPFVYVMTDFIGSTVDNWQKNPLWENYIKQGIVDFAVYDVEKDTQIQLLHSSKILNSDRINPSIVIMNYLLDSLAHDVFRVENNQLNLGFVELATDNQNMNNKKPILMKDVDCKFSYQKLASPFYPEKQFNDILFDYEKTLVDSDFYFPINALRCLDKLKNVFNNNLLFLIADEGDTEVFHLNKNNRQYINCHGSISMEVNFHAVNQYINNSGGDVCCFRTQAGLKNVAYALGFQFEELIETKNVLNSYFQDFGPSTLYYLYSHIRATADECSLETFTSLMHITHWDPHALNVCMEAVVKKLGNANPTTLQVFLDGMYKIAANFYYTPGAIDTLSGIAIIFQEVNEYDIALKYYELSLAYYGESDYILYNMGLCFYFLGEKEKAKDYFERALQLNPNLTAAQDWLLKYK